MAMPEDTDNGIFKTCPVTEPVSTATVYRTGAHESFVQPMNNQQCTDEKDDISTASAGHSDLDELAQAGLWQPGKPLRLHLGCGEQHFQGYINIDYPQSEHNVMNVNADAFANITELNFPRGSVDEIRLHHVFEHFNRVTALALLIKWHGWLNTGGILRIETPDLMGSAKTLLSNASQKVKMGVVRHLVGDQAAPWAYHIDQWYPERFERTLAMLGFAPVQVRTWNWPHEPFLSNVEVVATKANDLPLEALLSAADELLMDSTVAPVEAPLLEAWKGQLRTVLSGNFTPPPSNTQMPDIASIAEASVVLASSGSKLPLDEIHNFNQNERDRWIREKAQGIPAGASVLDVGAGTCPYRKLFAHCNYKSHDFKQYEGVKLGGTTDYGSIDYCSDITAIPVPDNSFDVVLCTEVLEHVPEPIEAMREFARILKPGGKMLLTAPLGCGLHQLPYHYYGGYTPEWYKHFAQKFGLEITEVVPNGGFFRLLAQETARVAWTLPQHRHLHGSNVQFIQQLFGEWIPRYLFALEEKCFIDQFTVGYHVEAVKQAAPALQRPLESYVSTDKEISARRATQLVGVVFSKDRPLQLEGTLSSFFLHCRDADNILLKVFYAASSPSQESYYKRLMGNFPSVEFIREKNFKHDLMNLLNGFSYVLFMVDDNIFVRNFSLGEIIDELSRHADALGFSLRLGKNTTYCYMLNSTQRLPDFNIVRTGVLKYDWTVAEYDFGYPVEVSSSVYRCRDLLPLLEQLDFNNPNTLEGYLAANASLYKANLSQLLCYEQSVAFCAPVNKVQTSNDNRAGVKAAYSVGVLADLYGEGCQLDVAGYSGFVPHSCHQEIELKFEKRPGGNKAVSIIMPCYNQACFLNEAVASVVAQSYSDWECIIVNDGSLDDTNAVARALIARFPACDILLVEQDNGGLASARNAGIRASRGKYILPLDADDKLHPDYLKETVRILETHPKYAIVYVDEQNFGNASHIHRKAVSDLKTLKFSNVHDYCSLYRREVWRKVEGYSPAMYLGAEDWNFWLAAAKHGFKSYHLPRPLFLYRNRENTMVSETLENLGEVWAHIVFHHPELYDRDQKQQARAQVERMPPKNRNKLGKIRQKHCANTLLNIFEELAGGVEVAQPLSEQPLVSVIIATHNRAALLNDALASLVAQDYANWEAVVVNDGGADVEAMAKAADPDGKVRYFTHDASRGPGAARNTGLSQARGEIMVYLDDDDLFLRSHLSTVVAALRDTTPGFVYTDARYATEELKDGARNVIRREEGRHQHQDYSRKRLLAANYIPINTWAHHRACLDKSGLFDESLPSLEDWDFLLKMARHFEFRHIAEVTVEVRERPSVADSVSTRGRKDFLQVYRDIYTRTDDLADAGIRNQREQILCGLRANAESTASFDDMYQSWISRHVIDEEAILRYRERMRQWRGTPVVHVIIDLQAGQQSWLADTLDSLAGQLLDNWRLSVIAEQPAPNELFNELDALRWELVPEGGDRCAVINKVAAEVAADWVLLGTAGDRYAAQFSYALADYANDHPQWSLIYSDDDCITSDGKHIDARFKPDFNFDLLRSMPYMGECCVLRRDLLHELGGYASSPDARNYDIVLRALDAVGETAIGHIADVLYHRCAADAETPANEGRIEQCRQALISHLQRNGVAAEVRHGLLPGSYFVDYRHAGQPLVSIIVPTRDQADLLHMCIASLLEKTDYPNYEILVIDNNTTQPAALELLNSYADIPHVRVLRHPGEYNFAAINNHAARESRGEYLLLLNNDTVVLQANWLTRLMAHGQRPEVGIVGARLVYPDQRLQHAGIILGMGASGVAEPPFMGLPMADAGYMGRAQLVQNYASVTAACLLIRKSLYSTVGGLDEHCFKVFYNDIDLCLKVGKQGLKIVWTPFVTLIHHGSASLKSTADEPAKIARARSEVFAMYERWLPALANDAAYNRNLSLERNDLRPDVDFIVPWRDTDRTLPRIAGFMLGSEGSWLYRVGSPLEVLDRERRADCAVMTRYEDRVRVPTVAELARIDPDIMLLHNTVHDSYLYMLELYKKFNRAFRVFGADDLMFALHGKNPFQKTVYRDMKKRMRTCLSLCDRLVVTTVPLAEAYRGMIDDIRVVPNYLDSTRWGHLQSLRRQGDKPRVGWAGATQHQGDLELIIDAVKETAKEVDWVFLGMCPEEIRPYVSEFHKGVPLEAYPEKLASLNLDLAVAPLEYHRFNEAKSNLRILEYGVLGWPVICSNIYPYQDAPVERVSNNPRAWINAIRDRIHDLDATAAEGDRLRRWVLEHNMLESHLDDWLVALSPNARLPLAASPCDPVQTAASG
ncbi:MAG: glycosyltransferase [Gammaproteobacteria bacterium]